MNNSRPTILIVDDDEGMRDTLEAILKDRYSVIKVEDGENALKVVAEKEVKVVLLDIRLPGINGLEVLETVKNRYEDIEVIMITVVREVDTAVKAMKLGAYDYITKEFNYDEVINLVDRAIEKQTLDKRLLYLRSEMEQFIEYDFVVGKSQEMREAYEVIQRVAKLPATVLITGETGTGKELVARIIHKESHLSENPFVTVNLSSIPQELIESTLFGHEKGAFTGAYQQRVGKFELAHMGTLFLDEVGDLKYELQAKLLRAIQEGQIERVGGTKTINVDARIIAATSVNLEEAITKAEFREDLYYRINVIPIKLPPLRERLVDIPQLAELFIDRYNKRFRKQIRGITQGATDVLCSYHWPGNIRELENLMERLVALCQHDMISEEDIPIEYYFPGIKSQRIKIPQEDLLSKACETFERNLILKALEMAKWSRKQAAKDLGIPLSTLKYKLTKLNLYDVLDKRKAKPSSAP
jgi:DNA-binding NtrC family response regulator